MAQEIVARGQISIIDLNDAKSLNMYLRSSQPTTQIFNSDNNSFVPSWSESPYLVITPELFVSGTTTDQMNQVKSQPVYTINGSTNLADFGATVATTTPYALTINKNMVDISQMRIQCSAVYTDPDIASFETPVKAEIQFTKTVNAGATICAIGYTPKGNVFKNDQTATLIAHCDMWRGSKIDDTKVSYQWYKMTTAGTWEALTSSVAYGCTGYNTNELTIPASAVLNFESFKCVITDIDEGSGTYNTTVSDILSFFDQSDPYHVEVYSTTGDKILNGKGSTTLTAKVWQAGTCFDDADANAKFNFQWKKYSAAGVQDTSWGTEGIKTGSTLTVEASEVTQKATFVCEIYSK